MSCSICGMNNFHQPGCPFVHQNEQQVIEPQDIRNNYKQTFSYNPLIEERSKFIDAIEEAWGVIANVSGGDWNKQPEDWQKAAMAWRTRWIGLLGKLLQEREKLKRGNYEII